MIFFRAIQSQSQQNETEQNDTIQTMTVRSDHPSPPAPLQSDLMEQGIDIKADDPQGQVEQVSKTVTATDSTDTDEVARLDDATTDRTEVAKGLSGSSSASFSIQDIYNGIEPTIKEARDVLMLEFEEKHVVHNGDFEANIENDHMQQEQMFGHNSTSPYFPGHYECLFCCKVFGEPTAAPLLPPTIDIPNDSNENESPTPQTNPTGDIEEGLAPSRNMSGTGNLHFVECTRGHRFCRDCLSNVISMGLDTRKVPIVCPFAGFNSKCSMPRFTVASVLSGEHGQEAKPQALKKYDGLLTIHKNQSQLLCNECYNTHSDVPSGRIINCECGHWFCREHGDRVHGTDETCAAYNERMEATKATRTEKRSTRKVARSTKPCSHCGAPITKNGGCNHMHCSACNQDFCWRCGTHEHIQSGYCHKCNRDMHEGNLRLAVVLVACVLLGPLMLAMYIVGMVVVGLFWWANKNISPSNAFTVATSPIALLFYLFDG